MKRRLKFATLALILLSLSFPGIQSAQAGCRDYPDSVTPECVAQNLAEAAVLQEAYAAEQAARQVEAERAAIANAERDAQDRAATAAVDAGLAADDCARSTNRYLQSCLDAQTAKAAAENAATNAAEQDAALEVAKIRPTLDVNGNVALNALLKSSSLGAQDIANVLATSNLSDNDKTLLTSYAQKLNAVKTTQRKKSFKLPLSDSLTEDFESTTPGICKVVDGIVKNFKPGTCKITLKFTTESGYEVQVVKKIVIRK